MIALKEYVSSSTKNNNSSFSFCPFSAQTENSSHRASQPLLCAERLATIPPNAAPNEPTYAAIEPPPGAGLSEAVSSANVVKFIFANGLCASARNWYSMIFFCGSNAPNSSSPKDFTAIFINSPSLTPNDLCCLDKKYFPVSSITFKGTNPTNSEPVTRIPLLIALLLHSSNAL